MPATTSTRLMTSAAETRAAVLAAQRGGDTIGFVPTMGALHAGHLSLVEAAQACCDRSIVSIFVNPTQFGSDEDLHRYPRELDKDLQLLEKLGCWLVFVPSTEEMYASEGEALLEVGEVARPWEGAARPSHFRGVATIVKKLFEVVPADRAFFGQKDYQQTLVVQELVRNCEIPIKIEVCPTVRESDGLAMSSRNAYLSDEQRKQARSLWQALQLVEQWHSDGKTDVADMTQRLRQHFATFASVDVEYIAFMAAGTVAPLTTVTGPTVVALAVRVGQTRLIDNHLIG